MEGANRKAALTGWTLKVAVLGEPGARRVVGQYKRLWRHHEHELAGISHATGQGPLDDARLDSGLAIHLEPCEKVSCRESVVRHGKAISSILADVR